VMGMARDLVLELKGHEVRHEDIICLNDRGGDAFLVFFSPKRREGPLRIADLKAAADRVEGHINRKLSRLASPYLGTLRRVSVGFALSFYNPLVMPERLVSRLVEEAWNCVHVLKAQRDLQDRCELQEVLLTDQLSTVFQPIVELRRRRVLGYEALSRGPAGSVYQMPLRLFEMAAEADLVFELDRKCRRRALVSAAALPHGAKLFVNVFPSAMYDPEFQGQALVALAESHGLTPDRVVLEITEKSAIENYGVLVELTKHGFSIAVDDVGAGYSGLEKIAHLNPRYLKFDRELVRNIDSSYIRREMTRALKAFADRIGSTIIAEGIERDGELQALLDLGIEYGQGFLLGRPAAAFLPPTTPTLATAS
jgi:EAL domain-containing protein (putative c-di-GMP-specific phosphodiesterase class I)